MSRTTRTTPPRTPAQQRKDRGCSRPTFDPALTGLAWALSTATGRIPVIP
ncbi:MAG: hypothetical protein LC792_01555 [Actinobacteria bacterium]|nr:hypothetical protein [Actinomycetota bacterium]